MFYFSQRLKLARLFEKWCLNNNLLNCPQNVVAFLDGNNLINEEKCLEFLKVNHVELNKEKEA